MIDLSAVPLWMLFAGGLALFVGTAELFRRLGRRSAASDEQTTGLQGSTLGLLALMIGFTFALSLSRFEARRDAVLTEANAIGTTALRARLLPAPQRDESLRLLRDYTRLRTDPPRAGAEVDVRAAIDRSNAIQERLWVLAMQVAAVDRGMVPTGLYLQTLNEMIDDQAIRVAAIRNHVPPIVLVGLYGITVICMAITGYVGGAQGRRRRLPAVVISLLIAFVLLLVEDLDRPGSGFIQVSQQPMIDTAASLAGFVPDTRPPL